MTAIISGYSSSLPTDVGLDSAVLYINSSTPYGVSKGEITVNLGQKFENLDFDNKQYDIATLDRRVGAPVMIEGTFVEFNATKMLDIEPGGTSATVSTTTTITPPDAGQFLVTGSYKTNVRFAMRRGGGGFVVVEFPIALMTAGGPITGKKGGQGEIKLKFEARQDPAAADLGVAPYNIQLVATL